MIFLERELAQTNKPYALNVVETFNGQKENNGLEPNNSNNIINTNTSANTADNNIKNDNIKNDFEKIQNEYNNIDENAAEDNENGDIYKNGEHTVFGFKRVENNKLSIITVQFIFCILTVIFIFSLKVLTPKTFLQVKDWYKINVKDHTSVNQIINAKQGNNKNKELTASSNKSNESNKNNKNKNTSSYSGNSSFEEKQSNAENVTETLTVNNYYSENSAFKNSFDFPLKSYVITSLFGSRSDPFTSNNAHHSGIDLAADEKSEIYSVLEGEAEVKKDEFYGNYVIIKHSDTLSTLYGHCSEIVVKSGQKVKKGDKIALVGSTGRSTGPHLHFEIILNGERVNPQNYINF